MKILENVEKNWDFKEYLEQLERAKSTVSLEYNWSKKDANCDLEY